MKDTGIVRMRQSVLNVESGGAYLHLDDVVGRHHPAARGVALNSASRPAFVHNLNVDEDLRAGSSGQDKQG